MKIALSSSMATIGLVMDISFQARACESAPSAASRPRPSGRRSPPPAPAAPRPPRSSAGRSHNDRRTPCRDRLRGLIRSLLFGVDKQLHGFCSPYLRMTVQSILLSTDPIPGSLKDPPKTHRSAHRTGLSECGRAPRLSMMVTGTFYLFLIYSQFNIDLQPLSDFREQRHIEARG